MSLAVAVAVPLPASSRVAGLYADPNLADAYAIDLPDDASRDPEQLARHLFAHQAPWVARLLWLRDALVAGFGLKTSRDLARPNGSSAVRRISFFRIYEQDTHEILLGEDDRHLDFRVTVRREPRRLVLSTVVRCHNRLGRCYIALIAPWHRLVVRSALTHAARAGWPRADAHMEDSR